MANQTMFYRQTAHDGLQQVLPTKFIMMYPSSSPLDYLWQIHMEARRRLTSVGDDEPDGLGDRSPRFVCEV